MNRKLLCCGFVVMLAIISNCSIAAGAQAGDAHDLRFTGLPRQWDGGLPLGNGLVGALVWQRENVLRIALDRADLWDLRHTKELESPEFRFAWVVSQVLKGDYRPVQAMGDVPYDRDPAPTKLPGAAIEFAVQGARVAPAAAVLEIDTSAGRTITFRRKG